MKTEETNIELPAWSYEDAVVTLLENLTKENKGWRRFFRRWAISDEPLRNDAATLVAFHRRIEMNRIAREASREAQRRYANVNPRQG